MYISSIFNSGKHDQEWGKACVRAIKNACYVDDRSKQKEMRCYRLMQGDRSTGDFDYLSGEGELKYPTKVRFIPLIRPLAEILKSTNAQRPIRPRIFSIDNMSISHKQDVMARRLLGGYLDKLFSRRSRIDLMREQLKINDQLIQQQGAEDPLSQLRMKKVEAELNNMDRSLQDNTLVVDDEIRKAERYFRYDYQTDQEVAMTGAMNYWLQKYRMSDVFQAGFEDLFTVDNTIYEIHDVVEGMDPKITRHSSMFYFYPAEQNAVYTDECEWGMMETYMSPSAIVEEFSSDLTPTQRTKINEMVEFNEVPYWVPIRPMNDMPNGDTSIVKNDQGSYTGSSPAFGMIRLIRCAWKVNRKLDISELDDVTNALITDDDDKENIKEKKSKDYRWVNDVWEGYCIGSDTFVRIRKAPFQFRDQQDVGRAYLPFVGYAFNGIDRKPYSIVMALEDIQILYNLVHHQQEMLIALSGVKGFIMDTAQMPDGYSPEEWMYFVKQGVAFIQSRKEGHKDYQFNQFQTYDHTVSQGVQYYDGILQRLEYLAGRIAGIPPQRIGEVTKNDQVGTNQAAISQSQITTEILFHRHNRLVKRALERVMDAGRLAWKNGRRGQYVAGDLGQRIFDLKPGDSGSASFELFLMDQGEQQRNMDRAIRVVEQGFVAGGFSTSQLISMFNIDSMHELQSTLEHYEELALRRAQEAEQGKNMAATEQERLKQEFQLAINKQKIDAEAFTGKLEQARLQLDSKIADTEAMLKNKEIETKADTERYKSDSESGVEMSYLRSQEKQQEFENKIEQLQLALDQISEMLSSAPKQAKKEGQARSKEKIKDTGVKQTA